MPPPPGKVRLFSTTDAPDGVSGEVHEDLQPLSRREHHRSHGHGSGQQAAVRADQVKRSSIAQRNLVDAGVRAVQQPQPVKSPVHRQPGVRRPVHQHHIAQVAGHHIHHGRRIDQLTGGADPLVREDERHIMAARRQTKGRLRRVFDDEETGHTGVSLLRRQLVRVRVIPASARSLADRKSDLVALPGGDLVARVPVHSFRGQDSVPVENQRFAKVVLDPRDELLHRVEREWSGPGTSPLMADTAVE